MFGLQTIRDGERVAVWDRRGRVNFVSGPRRIYVRGRMVESLVRHAAGADQYLVIRFKDGHSQHLHGPAAVWFHPVEHEEISIHQAVPVDANEAVVVYSHQAAPGGGDEVVSRRVVRGPALFMPQANEWLHEFAWHGADPGNPKRKVPRGLRFTKLRVIPDQMYHDVEDVRTADDALLTVRLMIFFELHDLEAMLDRTHDPVADFINAASADVMGFASRLTFEQFKEKVDLLSDMSTYRQLAQRAERIGYQVNKVVSRGYGASGKLQAMHDGAIEARTKLKLEAETERQSQDLADLKQQREAERAAQRREQEERDVKHANALKRLAHDEQLHSQRAEQEDEIAAKRSANELEITHQTAGNRERLVFLKEMEQMGVDLTRYLVAQYQHPDRHIRIDGGRAARIARVHVTEAVASRAAARQSSPRSE